MLLSTIMDGMRESIISSKSQLSVTSGAKSTFQIYAHDVTPNASGEHETLASLKQKRRRTSPRDHALLEAAYQRNSKPDKDERAELVKQVDLGEKEVQIWFQNRRQNDRRKSKPLLPHEMIPHFRNGVPNEVTRQLASPNNSQESLKRQETEHLTSSKLEITRPVSRAGSIHKLLNPSPSSDEVSLTGKISSTTQMHAMSTPPSSFEEVVLPNSNRIAEVQRNTIPDLNEHSHTGSLSKKRSHEEMAEPNLMIVQSGVGEKSHKLQRSSSFVRLAVTADGSFKVSTNEETTPSPQKPQQLPSSTQTRRETGLARSHSAIENGLGFKDINPSTRRAPGRSRDARTWEFYCDKTVREELTSRAEEQENGSAVNAINIMRSGSQSKGPALSPNPGKHNVHGQANKKRGKPAFTRTQSSMARLQGPTAKDQEPPSKGQNRDRRVSGSDSDKENWLPGTSESHHIMRRMHSSAARTSVLQEHELVAASRTVADHRDQGGNDHGNINGEKAKGDDLDCIHGLLSLSQGAWR